MGELVTVLNTAGGAFVAWAGPMLIQSSVLIILLAALDLVLRHRVKAVVRYWIWLLVLAKLILPPSFSSPTGVAYWVGGKLPTLSGPIEPLVGESSTRSLPADGPLAPSEPRGPDWRPDNTPLMSHAALRDTSVTWQTLVLFGWAVVVIVMAILLARRALFIHHLVAQSREPGPETVELLRQCARRMGVRTDLPVKLSPLSASPSVCGLRRPVILIPEGMLSQLPVHELRSVLFHELGHIKRGDLWLNLLQAVLQVVYFYHPLLWAANVRIRRVREQAVDETVLAALGEEAEDYPRTLLSVSRAAFGQPTLSLRLLGVVESEKALMDRIRHMVSRPFPKNARLGLLGLAAIAVIAAVLLPMARGTETRRSETSQSRDRLQTEDDSELAELIHTAVANHKGAGEQEIQEITRRITQGRAQILLLDQQIEEVGREIEATPASAETHGKLLLAKKEMEAKRLTQMANLREVMGIMIRLPFDKQSTGNLNAWVKLQVLEQRVVVLDTVKGFSDNWAFARHKVVGALSEKETLDYLQGRWKDGKSLPIRVHLFYRPETNRATEDLRQKIFALAREAHADMDTEVRLEQSVWVGSGESPFYLREGKIRTFYPRPVPRPDGGPALITSGVVDPNDLEQHILWRLTMPKNLPLTFRIEYDEASSKLARQVADTVKAVAKRVGLTDLVRVAETLIEPVPEKAFLGKWRALAQSTIPSIDIQPGGVCRAIMGEGTPALKADANVTGTWVWTAREIQLDINDPIPGTWEPLHYAYRATVNEEGNLVVERGEIYPQGSFMPTRPPRMIFKKVPQQNEPAGTKRESGLTVPSVNPPEAGVAPRRPVQRQVVPSLSTRLRLNVVDERMYVTDTLAKPTGFFCKVLDRIVRETVT
jgi:beta-lactamase regulating signal transducer with metallopeptidase domain